MNVERRSSQRETPEKLSYIQFEPEGGGIVLNASEQGLAFHAANAVKQPGPMRLSISPNPTQRLELSAEIVWLDDAKKFGKMEFANGWHKRLHRAIRIVNLRRHPMHHLLQRKQLTLTQMQGRKRRARHG